MAKPAHIQSKTGYATLSRRNSPQNQRVLDALREMVEAKLYDGRYGTLTLTVRIDRGTLQREVVVEFAETIRIPE